MSSPIFRQPIEVPKGWGHETHLASNDRYCGKLLCFNEGARFSAHFHDLKDESFFLLQGKVRFIYNDLTNAQQHEVILNPGDVVDIPRLCVHQVEAIERSIIIEVSSTDHSFDSYRVRPGDSQKAQSAEKAAPATFSTTSSDQGFAPVSIHLPGDDALGGFQSPGLPHWSDTLPDTTHVGRRANGKLIIRHYICTDDCAGSYGKACYTTEEGHKLLAAEATLS